MTTRRTQDEKALSTLRTEVESWFHPRNLRRLMGSDGTHAERVARSWLGSGGKRWRPLLAVCVCRALRNGNGPDPVTLKKVAIAVECFHKASLVHDDIEDRDDFRYGRKTLHREHGIPIALNIGDLLLGEGYRLLASAHVNPSAHVKMLAAAAEGHRRLSLGQGEELSWRAHPSTLATDRILEMFSRKTGAAFEVALRVGALSAGADDTLCGTLADFSRSFGIAYQIRDDLEDGLEAGGKKPSDTVKPSLLAAIAREMGRGTRWQDRDVRRKAQQLGDRYRREALRSLQALPNGRLRNMLRQVTKIILDRRPVRS